MITDRWTPKAVAIACLIVLLAGFVLEAVPHRHASNADRNCPACQAARQLVGDAPKNDAALLSAPPPARSLPAAPSIERLAGAPAVSSVSPRAPPSAA